MHSSRHLARFADQEGRTYLWRFYQKYRGLNPNQSLEALVRGNNYLTGVRAAVIYRSIRPQAGVAE